MRGDRQGKSSVGSRACLPEALPSLPALEGFPLLLPHSRSTAVLLGGALCPSLVGYSATKLLPDSATLLILLWLPTVTLSHLDFPNQGICRYKVLPPCHRCLELLASTLASFLKKHGQNPHPGTAEPTLGSPWLWPSPCQGHGSCGRAGRQCWAARAGDIQRRKRAGWMEEPWPASPYCKRNGSRECTALAPAALRWL